MQLLRGNSASSLRTAGHQQSKACLLPRHVSRARVANVRADFIKGDSGKTSPTPAPVKEETTVPNVLKPVPTVEAKEKAAPTTSATSQDALADLQHLKGLIETASKAQEAYEEYSQEQVDAIFKAAAAAASAARISLAVL